MCCQIPDPARVLHSSQQSRALWTMGLPVLKLPGRKEGKLKRKPEHSAQGGGSALGLLHFRQALLTMVRVSALWISCACSTCVGYEALVPRQVPQYMHRASQCNTAVTGPCMQSTRCHTTTKRYAFIGFCTLATVLQSVLAKPLTVWLYVHQLHLQTKGETDQKACKIAGTWLLTQARNIQVIPLPISVCGSANHLHWKRRHDTQNPPLQVLIASVIRLESFGAARGIKHLVLETPYVQRGRLSPILSVLEQLQILYLDDPDTGQQTCGALHLTALQSLRSVVLDGIVPASIQLPESCELHVVHIASGA